MRHARRYAIAALLVLLAAFGGYAVYWAVAARRIEDGLVRWAQSARLRRVEASWQSIAVGGFPAWFRVELTNATLRDLAHAPTPELRVAALTGDARPWDFDVWRLSAPQGLVADLAGAGGRPPLRLAADRADGAVMLAGGGSLWLRLDKATAEAGGTMHAAGADLWITWPATPPRRHSQPSFAVAADLHRVEVPAVARALGDRIDEFAFGATVKGALPGGNLVEAIAAWRDAGGTVELDGLHLEWGGLGVAAAGTIALDRELQPIGAFSGAIEGYDRVLRALVETHRMRPDQAALAQLVLTALAKPGPDGRPEIATSLTIENGQVFLGPARLGPAPRLAWR
jgi:hypothetical protein